MSELQLIETVFLIIVAGALIALVVKDIVLTARGCLLDAPSNFAPGGRLTSGDRLAVFLTALLKPLNRRAVLLKRFRVIVPLLQIIIWKALLVAGFAVLYLAIGWPAQHETLPDDKLNNFTASVWFSLSVAFRFALDEPTLDDPLILLTANMQFYSGFLFFGFVCFYLTRLRQKARQLKPRLYKLQHENDIFCYSPFALADSLREYRNCNLLLILDDWERWAEKLRVELRRHRQFIYGGVRGEQNIGWPAALGIVLDASAALIVTSHGAVEKKARRTFGAARRALIETSELIVPEASLKTDRAASFRVELCGDDDEVLSAPMIFESDKTSGDSARNEMLGVWRFTYEKSLRRLADELEEKIPTIKYDGQYC